MENLKNYVNGVWQAPESNATLDIINPSTGEKIGLLPLSSKNDVNKAVEAAGIAYETWREVSPAKRCKYLFKLLEIMNKNQDELCRLISLDEGKNITDASAELKRAIENLEVSTGIPSLMMDEILEDISEGIDGYVIKQSLGVFSIICPFNFPIMIPFWFFPYAVATGNTVVIKPSEQAPLAMNLVAKLVEEAGFPKGVINIIHGDKEVSEALIENPKVKGVSFVGSTDIAKVVAKKSAENGKRFQALGGAKNYFVVMPDAKMDKVIDSLMTSCYGCAGERCMAASVVVGVGDVYEELKTKFVAAAKALKVGNALHPDVAVGPVISAKSKERILSLIAKGEEEGAKLVLDGRNVKVDGHENGYYIGPSIFENVTEDMTILTSEIFGPVVCLLKASNIKEAIKMVNNSKLGNGASIFTQNGFHAREFRKYTEAGMIGVNVGVPAPMAFFPFGGMKDSIFGDIKAQGKGVIDFFTCKKVVTSRYFEEN